MCVCTDGVCTSDIPTRVPLLSLSLLRLCGVGREGTGIGRQQRGAAGFGAQVRHGGGEETPQGRSHTGASRGVPCVLTHPRAFQVFRERSGGLEFAAFSAPIQAIELAHCSRQLVEVPTLHLTSSLAAGHIVSYRRYLSLHVDINIATVYCHLRVRCVDGGCGAVAGRRLGPRLLPELELDTLRQHLAIANTCMSLRRATRGHRVAAVRRPRRY